MKEKILLTFSFIFSLVLFTFSADSAFNFLNVKISFSLIDFAGIYSPESYISTAFISYVFLLLFSFIIWKKSSDKNLIIILAILSILAFFFELSSIFKASSNLYNGQHLRIGVALSLFGLFILQESSKKLNV